MVLKNYLFSQYSGNYQQYTTDQSVVFLKKLCKNCFAPNQIAIHRDGNLIYYAYTHKRNEGEIYGLCIVCGEVCLNLRWLYDFFYETLETAANKGVLFCRDKKGKIYQKIYNLSSEPAEVDNVFREMSAYINKQQSYWETLPPEDFSVAKDGIIRLAFNEDNEYKITDAIRHYHNVFVTMDNMSSSSYSQMVSRLNSEKAKLEEEKKRLETEVGSLSKKKNNIKMVMLLSVLVIVGIIMLFNKENQLKYLQERIDNQSQTIVEQYDSINEKNDRIASLNSDIDAIVKYKGNTGATIRYNGASDNGWIMWLKANRQVKLLSFFVKGGNSSNGTVVLGMYDINDNLVATKEVQVYDSEFTRVFLDSNWELDEGYYYIRIKESNGISLQYHSSNDVEFSQFTGGALEVTGCCSYSNRFNTDSRNNHGYYQYFYDIQYEIVPRRDNLN